ncbi:MAG: HlyD family efflux transporter periplasmic adaptor subunit, partial [Planctomycetota bacterium]|nr:HlyD family efflux transporter periplasmic adaptor subunit [Planctomycetota bacterium]
QELETARIETERSKSQLDRVEKAAASNAVAQSEVDNAKAAHSTALASYQKVLARKTTLENELKVNAARKVQSQEGVNQAQLDLDDTELYAPFEGRISKTLVTSGTIVAAGTPVATLIALDPVKIEVTVSAARDRQIKTNDEVLVHTEASPDPIAAIVYQKSSAASATTRTFTLTLLCRNRRLGGAAKAKDAEQATQIGGLMRPQQFEIDGKLTWFVEERSIQTDENGGHFAWQVSSEAGSADGAAMDAKRVALKLGKKRKELLGLFKFRELIPEGEIAAALNGGNASEGRWKMVLAVGVPKTFAGGKVIKTTRRWMLRPGDIVDVQLELNAPKPGIYVPKRYIRVEGDKYFVFLVDKSNGKQVAKKVPVSVKANVGPLQRIEGADIKPGVQMITSGTHYLQDQTQVDIFEVTR